VVERYNPYYLVGAAVVVAASFVVVGLLVRRPPALGVGPDWTRGPRAVEDGLEACGPDAWWPHAVGVLLLAFVVATGLLGSPIESWNPAPVLLGTVLLVLVPIAQILAGDVWSRVSPWPARAAGRRPGGAPTAGHGLDDDIDRFGGWPAAALLALLLVLTAQDRPWSPRAVGVAALGYTALTLAAMRLLGRRAWLRHGEVLGVTYRLFAALRPARRPYAAELFTAPPVRTGMLALLLVLLAGGFLRAVVEARPWDALWVGLGVPAGERGPLHAAAGLGALTAMAGLSYGAACLGVSAATRRERPPAGAPALAFALALVPVVAGFHLAAGLDHAMEDGQRLVRLLSDPFGLGWDLFFTRSRPIARLDLTVVWHAQIALVVAAHVVAVYVAHLRALVLYGSARVAVRSQLPMLALMVLYTVSGLWALSTVPIVVADEVAPAR
jgi:hypothetical protein